MITKAVHPAVCPAVHKVDCTPWQYLDYNFYTDFTRSSTDQADDLVLSNVSSAGKKDYLGNTYGENVPVIEPGKGLLTYGEYTQLVPYSENTGEWTGSGPWTQAINITATGVYTVSTDLSTATITITAGTATIDAGASATYGTPDQFEVTGTGTITVSSDVANPKAQITKTVYKMPYAVNATSGTVTVSKSSADADEGSKYAISAGSKLEGAIDGVADGVELVESEASVFTGTSVYSWGWSVGENIIENVNNSLQITYVDTYVGAFNRLKELNDLTTDLVVDEYYEVKVTAKVNTGLARIQVFDGDESYFTVDNINSNEYTEYTNRFYAKSATSCAIVINEMSAGEIVNISKWSVKKISQAQGRMIVKWRPAFDAADVSTDVNIITANDDATSFLFWDKSENKLSLYDGTNTATVACTPVSGTLYTIIADYDGTTGMRLTLDSSAGSVETFAGGFPCTADNLSFGWDEATPQYVESLKFEEHPSW